MLLLIDSTSDFVNHVAQCYLQNCPQVRLISRIEPTPFYIWLIEKTYWPFSCTEFTHSSSSFVATFFITYYFLHISVFHSYSSKACYETINYLSCSIHIFLLLRQNIPICRASYVLEQSYYFSVKWEIGHICRKLWTYFCHRNCVNVSKKKHNTTKKAATFATVVVQHKSMASIF